MSLKAASGGATSSIIVTTKGYTTKILMDADATNLADQVVVSVTNDSTTTNNGNWRKSGAVGGGSMVKCLDTDVTVTNRLKADFTAGKNKFDSSDPAILTGKYLADNNGSVQTSASYSVTGYIHVIAGVAYTVSYKHCMVWYDASLNIILISQSTDSVKAQTAPAGAYFLRCSLPNTALPTFQVEVSASGVPSAYEQFHGLPELFTRMGAAENSLTFGSLNLSLADASQLTRAGATLQGGVLGVNPAISLPITNWALPGVFEVDIRFPADPNVAAAAYELMSLNQVGNSTPFFKLELIPQDPTVGYYVQTASMGCRVLGAASPLTQYFTPPVGAPFTPDAFSVRKLSPASGDVTIICEVMTDRVKIYNGGTTIGEWLFADYATVTALTAAMRTTLGSGYAVTDYNVAGFVPSDLARNIVYLCKAIPTVDPTNGAALGGTTYDSFESFMPVKGLDVKHRLRVEIKLYAPNPTWVQIDVFMDGNKILNLNNGVNLKTVGPYNFYLNYSTTGGNSALVPMSNFSYTNTLTPLPRVAVVMNHVLQDGPELPATGNAEILSSGRLARFISAAKKYGWTFGTYDEFLDMVMGYRTKRDKMIVILNDDSKFNYDDQPYCKQLFQENGIKNCTGLMTYNFNFPANAAMLQRIIMNGNRLCSHAENHIDLTKLSYQQFTANLGTSQSKALAAGYDINTLIAPGGYMSPEGGRWMLNNGWLINFTVPNDPHVGVLGNYYASRIKFPRITIDDWIPFSYVDTALNI